MSLNVKDAQSTNTINFSLDSIDIVQEVDNALFKKVRIKAFASGPNAHTLPIKEDVLKRGANTVHNKPILWKYNPYIDDAMGHEKDEVPCGFIPKEDNQISFERAKDGRLFLIINALIWTKYSGRLLDIIRRDGNKKDVSIEIAVVDKIEKEDGLEVLDFVIAGITILGEWINPAVKDCEMELVAFSEDKKAFESSNFSNTIDIDNTAMSSKCGDTDTLDAKVFNKIIKFDNKLELLREAYLVNLNNNKDMTILDHKYLHHTIVDNKLVLDKDALIASFQKASQNNIIHGSVKEHLRSHFVELGLNSANFSDFKINERDYYKYFSDNKQSDTNGGDKALDKVKIEQLLRSYLETFTFSDDEKELLRFSVDEIKDDTVLCSDNKTGENHEFKFSISEDEKVDVEMSEINFEDVEEAQDEDTEEEFSEDTEGLAEETEGIGLAETTEDDTTEEVFEDVEDVVESDDPYVAKLLEKIEALKASLEVAISENAINLSKIEAMSDYDDLKLFKEETERKALIEAEMAKVNEVIEDIENRGIEMSDEEKEEIISKVKEFSSVDSWANFAKAHVFDRVERVEGTFKIGLPFTTEAPKSNSIWDRI